MPLSYLPLKRKCCHFDEIFITGCTGSCQNDNFQCSQWWKFHQDNNISVSVDPSPLTFGAIFSGSYGFRYSYSSTWMFYIQFWQDPYNNTSYSYRHVFHLTPLYRIHSRPAQVILGNRKIYLRVLSFLKCDTKSFRVTDKGQCILISQYHGCFCTNDVCSQDNSSHGIDLNVPEYHCLNTTVVSIIYSKRVMSILRCDHYHFSSPRATTLFYIYHWFWLRPVRRQVIVWINNLPQFFFHQFHYVSFMPCVLFRTTIVNIELSAMICQQEQDHDFLVVLRFHTQTLSS